jgi:hypothetical protein
MTSFPKRRKKRSPRRSGINLSLPSRTRAARWAAAALVFLLSAFWLSGAVQKKKSDEQERTVQGTVTTEGGEVAAGAEVQLKNTKNLQIRSYIAQKDGTYFFHGLSPDVDYEVKAQYKGVWSSTKTVSSFDSRKDVTIDLKIKKQ